MKIIQKLRQAFSVSPGKDNQTYPQGEAKYNGKRTLFNRLLPYGLCSLEPEGTFVLLLNEDAVKFGIPSAMQNRFKNLQLGEVVLFNSVTGKYVYLKADGTIEIEGNALIQGDLNVSGDLTVEGDAEIGGISFLDHVHGGVDPGSGQSGPPE